MLYRLFTLLLLCSFALNCANKEASEQAQNNEDIYFRMNKDERRELAPNDLFRAIYKNNSADFEELIEREDFRFDMKNQKGDTALAVAIKLDREMMSRKLIRKSTHEDLKIKNQNDRSFVSLISEYDQLAVLDFLIQTYDTNRSQFANAMAYNFSNLDFEDEFSKNAAHYAKSAAMIDRLMHNWFKSALNFQHAFNGFFYTVDENGNTFLHNAAKLQRTQVILWYTDEFCHTKSKEDEEYWVGFIFRKMGDYVGDSFLFKKRYINRRNDTGQTPLHLAVTYGNERSVRQLMSCDQTDPTQKNESGRNAITELLKNLDPYNPNIDESYKRSFSLLTERIDPLWGMIPFNNFQNIITQKDDNCDMTALHYAARLEDGFFYEQLKDYNNQAVYNCENQTPEDLRPQ